MVLPVQASDEHPISARCRKVNEDEVALGRVKPNELVGATSLGAVL